MISSARGQAWRSADVCGSVPVYGRNAGRAFSPAAWGLRHRRVCGTMPASSPTDAGQGPAGVCGIPVGQSGNAPLRLRLAAHPPPLAGEALGGPPPGRLPCKGSCRRQPTEGCGALPCQYPSGPPHAPVRSQRLRSRRGAASSALSPVPGRNAGRAFSPAAWGRRHRRVCRSMRASSPTDAWQGPARVCRIPVGQSGNAPLRLRLAAHPPPLAGEALGDCRPIKPPL